jgi:outer membrane protein assembly factor BamB
MKSATSALRILASLVFFVTVLLPQGPTLQALATPPATQTTQAQPGAGDWPMYGHDPSRTNYNPDENLLNAGNVDKLVARWTSPDLGYNGQATSSAPSVANGKVYVGSSNPTGDNYYAFDAVTGEPVWSADLGYKDDCFSVGIGSTAAISGTMLVVGGGDDAYYGIDANTGKTLWRDPLGAGESGYPWESPVLANGRAYLGVASGCDNPSVRGEVRAVDVTTGSHVVSRFFVPEGKAGAGIWNSPSLTPDGSTLVVATGEDYQDYDGPYNRAIVSLDPVSLAVRSASKEGDTGGDMDFGTSPVVFHDSQGRTLVGAGHKNGTYYVYDLDNIPAGPVWSRPTGVRIGMMPAYDPTFGNGGTLFILSNSARLYAVDPATGNNRWPDVETNGRGNMAIANGLIFLNDNGVLRILDERDGHTLRVIIPEHQGSSNSGVAVSHGFVYWLSGPYLNAWSLPADSEPAPSATPLVRPPGRGSHIFNETGKIVSGIFLDYWQQHGGVAQQGYPITGLLSEKSDLDGKTYTVQYFERSVLEYHPENRAPYNVLLSQLGTFQYRKKYPQGAQGQHPNTAEGSVLFPQTGKRLGGKFLDYWQQHGGVLQQGYPISDEFVETSDLNGKPYLVQYFERAVFELHLENQPPFDVLLSQLGAIRFRSTH